MAIKKKARRDPAKLRAAGRKGGLQTLKRRGPEYFAEISHLRKNRRGGRPAHAKKDPVV